MPTMARNLTGSVVRAGGALFSGSPFLATDIMVTFRQEMCEGTDVLQKCEHYDSKQKRCYKCGCFIMAKIKLATESCPEGRW